MRTTPLPSADRRLPRMRVPGRALPVIWYSFVRVSPGLSRCAGHPAAAPIGPGTGQPFIDLGERLRAKAVDPPLRLLADLDQPRLPQASMALTYRDSYVTVKVHKRSNAV